MCSSERSLKHQSNFIKKAFGLKQLTAAVIFQKQIYTCLFDPSGDDYELELTYNYNHGA